MFDVSTKQARASFYGSTEWKQLRLVVIERDNHECQWCKENGLVTIEGDLDKYGNPVILEVDHIKELEDYPDLA